MNQSTENWSLRILAAYSQRWESRTANGFRDGVTALLKEIEQTVRVQQPSLHLEPIFLAPRRRDISLASLGPSVAFAIVDVSDQDEDLAYLVGAVQGIRIPNVLVRQAASESDLCTLDADGIHYKSHNDLFIGSPLLRSNILQAINQARILEELVYGIWFPRDTSTIWIVCPQIHEPGEFATRSSPDYTYLDNLGDTDALLEVMVFLSRYYPKATIEKFTSEDLPGGHVNNNLVVIGGPGSPDSISNKVCQEMMTAIGSHVMYSADCEKMLVTKQKLQTEFQAELRAEGSEFVQTDHSNMARDYGYFARFPNPLNETATVVLINGIHTAGVLGASRVFSDRRESLRNYHLLFNSQVDPKSFECHFKVEVVHGNVKLPAVDPENLYSLGVAATSSTEAMSEAILPQGSDNRRNSVTILFIAGDRGGTQRNQIQIPREFDSIQSALRGCQYRDSISLASPTLAATQDKLVEAYRQRPAILHFAGHGDDRSLSFIVDQGLVVSEAPLLAERLSTILQNFPKRIRLCLLNTCHSASVAKHLVETHAVDAAIGWPDKVADADAISFSGGFYGCLGDGLSLSQSIGLAAQKVLSSSRPELYTDDGVDPELLLVRRKD